MYRPEEMQPGRLVGAELDAMPPHFGKTQEPDPDFSTYRETAFANHGFHSHLIEDEKLGKNMVV